MSNFIFGLFVGLLSPVLIVFIPAIKYKKEKVNNIKKKVKDINQNFDFIDEENAIKNIKVRPSSLGKVNPSFLGNKPKFKAYSPSKDENKIMLGEVESQF